MEVKMEIKNVDGVVIDKNVPENLVSNYMALGWKVKENKKDYKDEEKEDKKASQNSLNK